MGSLGRGKRNGERAGSKLKNTAPGPWCTIGGQGHSFIDSVLQSHSGEADIAKKKPSMGRRSALGGSVLIEAFLRGFAIARNVES